MSNSRYSFENLGNDVFELYESGVFLFKFTRSSFRSVCESFALEKNLSSKWVGSILRLFLKDFPSPLPVSKRNDSERLIVRYGESAMVEYLRSKGFHVSRVIDVSLRDLVGALESRGYVIEGLLNDCYYNSDLKNDRVKGVIKC